MKKNIQIYFPEIAGIFLCLILGMLSGHLAHTGDTLWYQNLHKPLFTPPAWIFSVIWPILYIMMGIVLGKIIRLNNSSLRLLFVIQFTCNIIWSYIFFKLHRIDIALADITILWGALIALIIQSHRYKTIFSLLLPYLLWISFALILNYEIYLSNL